MTPDSKKAVTDDWDRPGSYFPVRLGSGVVGGLGLYTILSFFLPSLNAYLSYRVLVLGLMVAATLPLTVFMVRYQHAPESEKAGMWSFPRGATEARITILFIGAVTAYVGGSFMFPSYLPVEGARILVLSATVICLLCYFAVAKIIRRKQVTLAVSTGFARADRIAHRFYTSLGIFLLFPLCMFVTFAFPSLQGHAATAIVASGLTAAGLIGFWSVSKDVQELGHILEKAGKVARGKVNDIIETDRDGELTQLADAFNIIIAERNETIKKLEEAKQRIETLVQRVGAAVSSSSSLDELMSIVLDVCENALEVESVSMLLEPDSGDSRRVMTTKNKANEEVCAESAPEQLQRVIRQGAPVRDENFLAVPLHGTHSIVGAIGVRKEEDSTFGMDTEELLQNVAGQAALALEAEHLRENEENMYLEVITALAFTVEAKDPYTRGHSHRVSEIATAIGEEMDLDQEDISLARDAALLHDIGKTLIPEEILNKPGKLNNDEWEIIKKHTETGFRITSNLEDFVHISHEILHHHERWDGSGYPEGLAGEEIPLLSRMLTIIDSYDVMISGRPYKKAMTEAEAAAELKSCAGSQFDPELTEIFIEIMSG